MTTQNNAYLALPNTGSGDIILVLHAWWGLNESIKVFCNRLAEEGFVAFAPDLYHGKVTDQISEAEKLVKDLNKNANQAEAELLALANFLKGKSGENQKITLIGFSLGANYALHLSNLLPEIIQSVVVFYGTGPDDFSNSKANYLGHFAAVDEFEPQESVDGLEDALKSAGRAVTFYQYPETGHWFFEPDRLDAYNSEAANLAWQRTIDFLKRPSHT